MPATRLSDLGLVVDDGPGQHLALVRVLKGGGIELGGREVGSGSVSEVIMRQLYQTVPLIPTNRPNVQATVYGYNIGSISNATSSLNNSLKIPTACEIAAFAFGQWNSSGVYVPNNSRWDLYRNSNYHFFGEDIGSTSTVKGVSDLLMGYYLSQFLGLGPFPIIAAQALGLDVRNEGTGALFHDACVYNLVPYDVPAPMEPGEYDIFVGVVRFATGDYSGNLAGPKTFTFQQPAGGWLLGILGHGESANGSNANTALQVKILDNSGASGYALIGGNDTWVTDQLVFGAYGQRPFVLPTPRYFGPNGQVSIELNNRVASSPSAFAYEMQLIYLTKRPSFSVQ